MKKLVVHVDMDGIAVDLLGPLFRVYAMVTGDPMTYDDCHSYDFRESFAPIGEKIWDVVKGMGFFARIPPMPGAIDGINTLIDQGHDVYILSSPEASQFAPSDKIRWCREYLPRLDSRKVILTSSKHMIKGDVLIDDNVEQQAAYKLAWPEALRIAISYPYNKDIDVNYRFDDASLSTVAWENIVRAVNGRAYGRGL